MLCFKKLLVLTCILIALMSIGLAVDEGYTETITKEGLRFDSNQTVEGFGIASTYRCMESLDRVLHSHSSGSGVFTSESKATVRDGVVAKITQDSFKLDTGIGLQENTSNAYSPTKLNFPGSFRSGPITSLWSDSTFLSAGNDNVNALEASFDQAQALNKEMTTKVSGIGSYEDILSSTSFAGSMELNAVFNGTAQIGAYVGPLNGTNPDVLMDEYYRGTFTISKKMKIGFKSTLRQDEEEGWLPCCSGGWGNMDLRDKKSFPLDVNRVFNCTCFSVPK